jgi:hypothetical protein
VEIAQLSAILHNPLGALLCAANGRLLLSPVATSLAVSSSMAALMGGANYEPPAAGEWGWIFSTKGTYRSVESNVVALPALAGQEGHVRIMRLDLDGHMVSDRWVVSVNVPYQSWKTSGAYDGLEGESLAIQVVPQYFIMKQDSEVVDLSVFAIGGYEHNWLDDDPGIDDTDYVTWGFGALIGKSFCFGDLSLGYAYQPWINIDGDTELDGTDTMDYHRAELAYTFGMGEQFYGQLKAIWKHTEDLPSIYDSDEYLGRAMLGYATETWGVEAGYGRTIASDDYREWDADLSVFFRW